MNPAVAAAVARTGTATGAATGVVVELDPPATAMVWRGIGSGHRALSVPRVVLGPGEALVQVELATVCGSDAHTVSGARPAPAPLVLGHEQVGRLTALGPTPVRTVDGADLRVGDRVVWSLVASCGACDRCGRDLPQKCRSLRKYGHEPSTPGWELSGSFATHTHLRPGTALVRVRDDVPSTVLGPVACGGATAWAALGAAAQPVWGGLRVLVSGAGLIGLCVSAMASDRGAFVTVTDPDPDRRALAGRFGAIATFDPRGEAADAGWDVVVEASGAPAAVVAALAAVDTAGTVVLVGSVSPAGSVPLDPERVVRGLLTVRGVHNYAPADLVGALSWAQDRAVAYPLAALVADTVPLHDIDDAVRRSGAAGPVRIGVDPQARA